MTIWMKSLEKLEIENMDDLVKFSEFADKMIRNNILTPDEVREMMGYEKKEEDE